MQINDHTQILTISIYTWHALRPWRTWGGGREPLFLIWKVEMRPPALAPARLAAWFHPQPLCSEVTHRRVRGEAGL